MDAREQPERQRESRCSPPGEDREAGADERLRPVADKAERDEQGFARQEEAGQQDYGAEDRTYGRFTS